MGYIYKPEKGFVYKEEGMKKAALVMVLFLMFVSTAGATNALDDKEFRTGLKHYNSKNYKEAVKYFKEYTSRKPDPTAYYLIGYSLYKQKRFDEADEYFKQAYLIDPEFSLEKVGLIKKTNDTITEKTPAAPATVTKPHEPEAKPQTPTATKAQPSVSEKPASVTEKTAATEKATARAQQPPPAAKEAPAAQKPALPAPSAPHFPAPKKQAPGGAGPAAMLGILAAFGMIAFVIAIAFYAFYCLCMYMIAKKLNVPAPWTAWIPLIQIWTFVMSAGKPAWWILLLFVPLINIFVGIYLWMCITENLGKNKWLGLLVLVPLIGFLYPAWLAFMKTERAADYGAGETLA